MLRLSSAFYYPHSFQTYRRLLMVGYNRCCELGFDVEKCGSLRHRPRLLMESFRSLIVRMRLDGAASSYRIPRLVGIYRPSTKILRNRL
jgi:hypothetical protein